MSNNDERAWCNRETRKKNTPYPGMIDGSAMRLRRG